MYAHGTNVICKLAQTSKLISQGKISNGDTHIFHTQNYQRIGKSQITEERTVHLRQKSVAEDHCKALQEQLSRYTD